MTTPPEDGRAEGDPPSGGDDHHLSGAGGRADDGPPRAPDPVADPQADVPGPSTTSERAELAARAAAERVAGVARAAAARALAARAAAAQAAAAHAPADEWPAAEAPPAEPAATEAPWDEAPSAEAPADPSTEQLGTGYPPDDPDDWGPVPAPAPHVIGEEAPDSSLFDEDWAPLLQDDPREPDPLDAAPPAVTSEPAADLPPADLPPVRAADAPPSPAMQPVRPTPPPAAPAAEPRSAAAPPGRKRPAGASPAPARATKGTTGRAPTPRSGGRAGDNREAPAWLAVAGLFIAVWAALPHFVTPPLDTENLVEIVDHVVPGLVVFAVCLGAVMVQRRTPGEGGTYLFVGGLVLVLAGLWMVATHLPLVAQATRDEAPWAGTLYHSASALSVLVFSLIWMAANWNATESSET